MSKKLKAIPKFGTKLRSVAFGETHDSTDYIDWSQATRMRFPNLKPSTTSISLRLPLALLERIKVAANKRDVSLSILDQDLACRKDGRTGLFLKMRRTRSRYPW